jgi:cytosine/adenosine deaminase-related metal-dependent hydrolase
VTTWHCEYAWVDGACAAGVRITVAGERIAAIETAAAATDDRRLAGVTIPGLANAHSHVFHRALRGRTHEGRGDFWVWREAMYAVANRLDPDSFYALARTTYAEMVLAGFTAVG